MPNPDEAFDVCASRIWDQMIDTALRLDALCHASLQPEVEYDKVACVKKLITRCMGIIHVYLQSPLDRHKGGRLFPLGNWYSNVFLVAMARSWKKRSLKAL